jgi:hypothetical protein
MGAHTYTQSHPAPARMPAANAPQGAKPAPTAYRAAPCRYSEQSRTKCIGLTIETRPDFCLTPHLTQMLSYGCTRLEIGLQSTYEDVARDTNRGHTVAAVAECFHLAKDAGFKVRVGGWGYGVARQGRAGQRRGRCCADIAPKARWPCRDGGATGGWQGRGDCGPGEGFGGGRLHQGWGVVLGGGRLGSSSACGWGSGVGRAAVLARVLPAATALVRAVKYVDQESQQGHSVAGR